MIVVFAALLLATAAPQVGAPSTTPSTAPSANPERARVFVPDLKTTSVERSVLNALQGRLVEELARYPQLDIVSNEDVRRALSLEAEKQALGCQDEASCFAEIAAAMGADLTLFGDVERVEGRYAGQLNLSDVAAVSSRGRVGLRGASYEELSQALPGAVRELLASTFAARGWSLPERAPEPAAVATTSSGLPLVVTGVGGVVAVSGVALVVLGVQPLLAYETAAAQADEAATRADADPRVALDDARAAHAAAADEEAAWASWGLPLVAVGGVAVAFGLAGVVGGLVWGAAE